MEQLIVFLPILLLLAVVILLAKRSGTKRASAERDRPAQPIAHTPDGTPIYPVVGYTPDGKPITADRAVGYRPTVRNTNGMAIAALICGFTVPLIAIPLGHIARSQIRKTGEQGDGLALAGLILGYLSLISIAIAVVVILVAVNQ